MNIMFFIKPKADVACLRADSTVRQGLEKLIHHGYTAIPVIDDDGKYVGTVSEGDFLRCAVREERYAYRELEELPLSSVMRMGWNPPVHVTDTMEELLVRVMEQNFVPVVDDRGCFVGIITRRDIIRHFCDTYVNRTDAAEISGS